MGRRKSDGQPPQTQPLHANERDQTIRKSSSSPSKWRPHKDFGIDTGSKKNATGVTRTESATGVTRTSAST